MEASLEKKIDLYLSLDPRSVKDWGGREAASSRPMAKNRRTV
jgi:hypothetical protein